MPMSLNPSRCWGGGASLSNIPPKLLQPPPPRCKDLPSASSREPPSPLGALRSLETKARNSPPLHLHPGASAPRAPARLPRDVRKPALRLAPEPLAAPARRIPGTEPDPAAGGGGGQPREGRGPNPNRKCTRTLRILNQPVNSRRLGPSWTPPLKPPCLLDAPSPEAVALLPLQRPRGADALTHARTGPGRLG